MVRRMTLLAVGALCAAAPLRAQEAAVSERVSEREVDAAVSRGVAWLVAQQARDGSFGAQAGETALALLALRHAGAGVAHPAVEKAARRLLSLLPDGTVYGASLGILALAGQPGPAARREVEKLVRLLVAGQCRNGQWTYAYRATARKRSGDNSNTQLAVLALAAARVRRVPVPAECFTRLRTYLAATQNEDGGFGYSHNQRRRSYGSMTAGGAMGLALCRWAERAGTLPDTALASDPEVRRALDWLAREFEAGRNRDAGRAFGNKRKQRNLGDSFWRHYWLWSLERACSVAGVDRLGGRDWYAEGARFLLGSQRPDGSWRDPESKLRATCFALLFLRRSTRAVLTPRPGDVATTPGATR